MTEYDVPDGSSTTREAGPPDASTAEAAAGPRALEAIRETATPGAQGVLRPPRHLVHPKARQAWRVSAIIGWLVPLVPVVVVAVLLEESRPWTIWAAAAIAVIAALHAAVMPELRYRIHRWEVDDEAVYTRVGWITQASRVAPVSRIQTVDSAFGPIQRLFGLGRLTVTTASAAGPLSVDGLARAEVEALVTRLTAVTARDSGDAT